MPFVKHIKRTISLIAYFSKRINPFDGRITTAVSVTSAWTSRKRTRTSSAIVIRRALFCYLRVYRIWHVSTATAGTSVYPICVLLTILIITKPAFLFHSISYITNKRISQILFIRKTCSQK